MSSVGILIKTTRLIAGFIFLCAALANGFSTGATEESGKQSPAIPTKLIARTGDRSVTLHWDYPEAGERFEVQRAHTPQNKFVKISRKPLALRSYADTDVTNGISYSYIVRVETDENQNGFSTPISVTPKAFADDKEFLTLLQQTAFDFFWFEANPTNGLVRDRSR